MEDLNKNQIILLTLLVSFVTSIATGIVTVSLLDQAPAGVTQTINRVVEKTIEKVVPFQAPAVVTKEVQVKDEDFIVSAVEKNAKSLVRIKDADVPSLPYVKIGLVVSNDGLILSDAIPFDPTRKLLAVFPDGKTYPLLAMQTTGVKISVFKTAGDSVKDKYVFSPASFSDSNMLKLGQTVVSLGGPETRNLVGVGVISGITYAEIPVEDKEPKKVPSLIQTNLNPADGASGFYLLNLAGEIVGIYLEQGDTLTRNLYIPIDQIKDQIPVLAVTTE